MAAPFFDPKINEDQKKVFAKISMFSVKMTGTKQSEKKGIHNKSGRSYQMVSSQNGNTQGVT